jgi:hypothetical protein
MEIDFPFRGWLRFDSLEWGEKHMVEAGSFRKAYMESLKEYMDAIRTSCTMYGMNYGLFRTNEPWREKLVDILASRLAAQERS